jgi:hypothetical protein
VVALVVAMIMVIKLIEDHFKSPHAHRNVINLLGVVIAGGLVYAALDCTGLLPSMPNMPWQHHVQIASTGKHRAHGTSLAQVSQPTKLAAQNGHVRHWRVQ